MSIRASRPLTFFLLCLEKGHGTFQRPSHSHFFFYVRGRAEPKVAFMYDMKVRQSNPALTAPVLLTPVSFTRKRLLKPKHFPIKHHTPINSHLEIPAPNQSSSREVEAVIATTYPEFTHPISHPWPAFVPHQINPISQIIKTLRPSQTQSISPSPSVLG